MHAVMLIVWHQLCACTLTLYHTMKNKCMEIETRAPMQSIETLKVDLGHRLTVCSTNS